MMNTRVSIWQKALRMVLALALAATAVPFVAPDKAHADWVDNTYHITSVADLVYAVNLTHTTAGQSINIVLDNDLTLNEADLEVAKQNGGLIDRSGGVVLASGGVHAGAVVRGRTGQCYSIR